MDESRVVLSGSELNGSNQGVAEWAGIEVPDDKWDAYVDLVGGVRALEAFFEDSAHGTFEITAREDDMGPGLNDTYWEVSTTNQDALRREIRERLVRELGLGVVQP